MRYLFCGSFCQMDEEEQLLKWSKSGLQSSIINFQRNMLQGLKDVLVAGDSLDIINYYPMGSYGRFSTIRYLKGEKKKGYRRLRLINLPLIKQVYYNLQASYYIRQWVRRYRNEEKVILMYDLLTPYLKTLSSIKQKKLTRCTIVADLPNEFGYKKNDQGLMAIMKKHIGQRSLDQVKKLDRFGLLTKEMSNVLGIPEDKYVVIEGFSDASRPFAELKQKEKKIILYSGVVSKAYQLDVLVEAFKMIKDLSTELWICGYGDYVWELKKECEKHDNIKYMGTLKTDEVALVQSKSTILINPRQNKGEYTKYSFPSKIIEYLSTARPVIAYKLDGIPNDYYNYIIAPKDNSVEELYQTILKISNMPFEEQKQLGINGRRFVLNRNNPYAQITKLLNSNK